MQQKYLILYADDDKDDQLFIEEAFIQQTRNVELMIASDGEEVFTILGELLNKNREPSLIILDVNMPKLSGKEALIRLRKVKKLEEVPVVLFTTSSLPKDEEFASQYRAGFITKPMDSHQMQQVMEQFIAHCTEEVRPHIRKSN